MKNKKVRTFLRPLSSPTPSFALAAGADEGCCHGFVYAGRGGDHGAGDIAFHRVGRYLLASGVR